MASGLFGEIDKTTDEEEHSLEMQYPFLKLVLKEGTTVIPIMVGSAKNMARISNELLKHYFEDCESLFVFSTDFCHWGKRFGYTSHDPKHQFIYQSIRDLDLRGVEAVQTRSVKLANQSI